MKKNIYTFCILIWFSSCEHLLLDSTYNINQPDHIIELPKKLNEISGLTNIGNNRLAAIQDEKGKIFIINTKTGKVETQRKFSKDEDYEGIARVNDKIFAVENTGTIHEIAFDDSTKQLEKYNTWLSKDNNVEGLCYLPEMNALLLVCKAQSGKKKHKKGTRSVYAFDLTTKTLSKKPFLTISEEAIGEKLNRDMIGEFQPSGIAVSPIDGKIYVISSVGKAIAIFSSDKLLQEATYLVHSKYIQPEGIEIDTDGTLYISNEGKNDTANVLIFNAKGHSN